MSRARSSAKCKCSASIQTSRASPPALVGQTSNAPRSCLGDFGGRKVDSLILLSVSQQKEKLVRSLCRTKSMVGDRAWTGPRVKATQAKRSKNSFCAR